MPRRTTLALLALVVLAGCTSPLSGGGEDGGKEKDVSGVKIDLTLTEDKLFEGGVTELILQVSNYNPEPLTSFNATLANPGDLNGAHSSITLVAGTQDGPVTVCDVAPVPAEGVAGPGKKECIWEINPQEGFLSAGKDSVTYPLLLLMRYRGMVYNEEKGLSVSFQKPEDITPGGTESRTLNVQNGDIKATVEHRSPVSTGTGEVKVTITVTNAGSGHIVGPVQVTFDGSLMDQPLDTGQSSCLKSGGGITLNFLRSQQTNTVECRFVVSNPSGLDDTSLTLRPEFTYMYRVSHELPLTILDR